MLVNCRGFLLARARYIASDKPLRSSLVTKARPAQRTPPQKPTQTLLLPRPNRSFAMKEVSPWMRVHVPKNQAELDLIKSVQTEDFYRNFVLNCIRLNQPPTAEDTAD